MSQWNNPLKIEEIGIGEQAGTWGLTTNTNLALTLPEAITGRATAIFPTDGPYSLPYIDNNGSQVFRNLVLNVTSLGNLSATQDLIIPAIEKQYFVENNTSGGQSIRVKTATGTGVTIPHLKIAHVFCDGTNTRFADNYVGITGGSINGTAIGGSSPSTAVFTTLTTTNLVITSPLPATSGGTGLATATQGDIIYASASNTYAALPKNTTATRYLANTGTDNNPAWAQIDLTNGVTGDLPLANLAQGTALSVLGVTGNATADNASIAAASDHQVLRRSGTSVAFGAVALDQTNAVTGILPVANGGTGVTTSTGTGSVVLSASPTFTGTVTTAAISMADNYLTRPLFVDYAVEGSIIGNAGATRTLDLTSANFFSLTINQACTFTFINPPTSGKFGCFTLEVTNGAAFNITWPASVDWPGGTAPTLTSSGKDQLVFTTRDAGTTWFGFLAGKDIK